MIKPASLDLNERFKLALDLMENTARSVFITGRAGTGKSTLLSYFRSITNKKVSVLAPTGVAALNVRGQTIHSFFGFKPHITPEQIKKPARNAAKSIYKKLDAIIIDEVSMVRADLLDCVDRFLRLNGPESNRPFGGIQMIFIGDLYQLPPVVTSAEKEAYGMLYETPYFYSARVFDSFQMELIELEKIYRQHDEHFISLLNAIRNKSVTEEDLKLLNTRYLPDFEPPRGNLYVYLTTTNALAEEINFLELAKLRTNPYTFTGIVEGDFGNEYLPTAIDLQVRVGAQIMMLNNDSAGRWVNGTIGKVVEIVRDDEGNDVIIAELPEAGVVAITPYTWEIFRFFADGKQLKSEVIGTFTQYPLMLAWAITIHKSQGKTFNKAIIDIGKGTFTHGQMYVALSRCTTLQGMVLKKPALKKHIWMDYKVVDFLTKYQYNKAEQSQPAENKLEMITAAIRDRKLLEIEYLKPNDERSKRTIKPEFVGEMEYKGKKYLGVRAFCLKRNDERIFRIDRILNLSPVTEK